MGSGLNAADLAERKLVAAHQVLLRTRGLQLDFSRVPAQKPPPHWVQAVLNALGAAAPVLVYVFWAGLAAAFAAIFWIVIRDLGPPRFRRRPEKTPVVDWQPGHQAALSLLDEADQLAAAGRFGEAIHLLLFRSIEELAAKRPGAASAALTTREIALQAPMPEEARTAFARLGETVERSFFGGRDVDVDLFQRSRRDYEVFAFSEGWR